MVFLARATWIYFREDYEEKTILAVGECKKQSRPEELCNGMPKQMNAFFLKVFELEFEERPDYGDYRRLFREGISEIKESEDGVFDWDKPDSPRHGWGPT